MLPVRGIRLLFAVALSVLILVVSKPFLGDSPDKNPPDGIEVNRRVGGDSTVFVLINNFKSVSQDVKLPGALKSLLDRREVTHVQLPQYGVAILAERGKR